MDIDQNMEVIVGTYEELTLGYRLVTVSEDNKVGYVLCVKYSVFILKLIFFLKGHHKSLS